MDIKTTLDNGAANYAKNLRDLLLQLNYDKGASTAKVSINSYEFIKEEAEQLKAIAEGEGLGIGFGVPYTIEIGEKGNYEKILDGVVNLLQAEKISCREVIAPVIDKGGNDSLTERADSFSFEFLFERRPDLLDKTKFQYVPYVKNRPDNAEITAAVFSLISLVIQLTQAIESLIGAIAELAAFSWEKLVRVIVLAVYVFFLTNAAIQLTQAILDMILAPVKYHAGMKALDLCRIGAEYLGYDFSSTILEGDYEKLVIIPPKNETIENENNQLVTGFTQPNADEQTGVYQGTFGDLLRALITTFNGKIIIEENLGSTGRKTIRLERDDFNQSQQLYTMPDVDFDGVYKPNTDEFNAATRLQYQFDSQDINTYQFYPLANVLEVLEPVDKGQDAYCNLFSGYNEIQVPFSMGVRKDATRSRQEQIIIDILDVAAPLLEEIVFIFNTQTVRNYQQFSYLIDLINSLLAGADQNQINVDLPAIEELIVTIPDFRSYANNREGVMYLEKDYLSTHRLVMLEEGYTVNLTQSNRAELGQFALDNDFPFATEELVDLLSGIETSGEAFQNQLTEDNNEKLSALTLYQNFHQINSFLPTDDRPLGNQWHIYEVDNVPFCYSDWQLLKTDNRFKNAQGEDCLLESLEWNPFQNKANFRYRINKNYFKNLQLKDNRLILSNGK